MAEYLAQTLSPPPPNTVTAGAGGLIRGAPRGSWESMGAAGGGRLQQSYGSTRGSARGERRLGA